MDPEGNNYVPILGCLDVKLTNEEGRQEATRVYVTRGQRESLLGKEDATKLVILKINRRGDPPDEVMDRNSTAKGGERTPRSRPRHVGWTRTRSRPRPR